MVLFKKVLERAEIYKKLIFFVIFHKKVTVGGGGD
jgi:hypothetical protein